MSKYIPCNQTCKDYDQERCKRHVSLVVNHIIPTPREDPGVRTPYETALEVKKSAAKNMADMLKSKVRRNLTPHRNLLFQVSKVTWMQRLFSQFYRYMKSIEIIKI